MDGGRRGHRAVIRNVLMHKSLQVADSAFTRLTELMTELVVEQKLPIPRPFMRVRSVPPSIPNRRSADSSAAAL